MPFYFLVSYFIFLYKIISALGLKLLGIITPTSCNMLLGYRMLLNILLLLFLFVSFYTYYINCNCCNYCRSWCEVAPEGSAPADGETTVNSQPVWTRCLIKFFGSRCFSQCVSGSSLKNL